MLLIGQQLLLPGLGEQLLLLSEQLLLRDAQVFQPRALAAPLSRDVLTLAGHLLHLLAVVGEAQLVQSCRQAALALDGAAEQRGSGTLRYG